ncbi:MAG: hypothetical protein ACYDD4_01575 [Acidimicrobiales bacterium]
MPDATESTTIDLAADPAAACVRRRRLNIRREDPENGFPEKISMFR